MGRDIVATAKEFEDHAQKSYPAESLARELHNLSGADRLAVAKQIDWDMKHQSNTSLPKIDFFDSGDLKSVERSEKTGSTGYTEHYELDKDSSKIKTELKTSDTNSTNEHIHNLELVVKDSSGHTTYRYEASTEVQGASVKASFEEENWKFDATSGKKVVHDQRSSAGKIVHEEFDGTNGNQKSANIADNSHVNHQTYDSSTGNLKQEEIVNNDNTREEVKYNSNGDKISREKNYGNNGDQGTREWVYSPRTGKPVYTEFRGPDGKTTKNNIDENGKYTAVQD